jgi:hypothetical protein
VQEGEAPCMGLRGQCPQEKNFYLGKRVTYLGGFLAHDFFADGFLFPVNELGLFTNPIHWLGFWMPLAPICIFYYKQYITMN